MPPPFAVCAQAQPPLTLPLHSVPIICHRVPFLSHPLLSQVPLFSDKCEALLVSVAEKKEYFLQRCAAAALWLASPAVLCVLAL